MSHEVLAPQRLAAVVLLPFGLAYFLSYGLRNINALIAGTLMIELDIGASQLGLLTGVLFLAMAVVQLPLGVALDRYGPRRVQSVLLLFVAVGAVITSMASSIAGLLTGRILIGIGTSTCLMAGLKAIVMTAPQHSIARANGILIMLGASGAVAVTAPADGLLAIFGWRGLFQLAAVLTMVMAALIIIVAPERHQSDTHRPSSPVKLSTIYADPRFQALAPLSALTIGASWSLQGLWAGPWLTHVSELDHASVVKYLLVIGIALALGAAGLGCITDRLKARGCDREIVLVAIAAASLTAMVVLVLQLPVSPVIPWSVIAIAGAATTVSYAILPGYFAAWMSARANAALNLLHLLTAFGVQAAIGVFIDQWPKTNGHPPAEAYQAALGCVAVLQALALTWFVVARRRCSVPVLTVRHPLLRVLTPVPLPSRLSAYDLAQTRFSEHLGAARVERGQWRRAALSAAMLCLMLTGLVGVVGAREVVPYLVATENARTAHAFLDRSFGQNR